MKDTKKILIGVGIVAALCCCAAVVSLLVFRQFSKRMVNVISTEPADVEKVKQNIAEFDTPEGYKPVSMSFLGYNVINLVSEDSDSRMTIMLMQYSSLISGNSEQMKEQLRQAAQQQGRQPGMSMKLVETREAVIRGETVEVTISESTYQGFTFGQWMTVFTGNKGPAILMIQGPVEDWDDQFIEDFIESFH